MAAKKKIDPEKLYQVELSRPVEIAPGAVARVGDRLRVKGEFLLTIQDKVESFEEAPPKATEA
jgi:hypothetical protein